MNNQEFTLKFIFYVGQANFELGRRGYADKLTPLQELNSTTMRFLAAGKKSSGSLSIMSL
jgi:hypothetical protein